MGERIDSQTLYHVSVTKPYKNAFVRGQSARIGDDDCPYFRFYEGVREYPVNDAGQTIRVKAIQWLRHVQSGRITPAPGIYPKIALEVALHYVMLCRELVMEEVRTSEFGGGPPSRQKCLYACLTLEEARRWKERLGESGSICELRCSGAVHRADASLLLADSEPLSVTRERARAYWRGDQGDSPEMETLFVGDVNVVAVDL